MRLKLAEIKRLLDDARTQDGDQALAAEAEALMACMESADWEKGKRGFEERRPPGSAEE